MGRNGLLKMVNDINVYVKLMCNQIISEDYTNLKENAEFILEHLQKKENRPSKSYIQGKEALERLRSRL